MKRLARVGMIMAAALLADGAGLSQTVVNPSGQKIVLAGQSPHAVEARVLNEKQQLLANQTDRLLNMATELKEQVDMTSKNILSLKVVRKAEEIELYARRMKGDAKR